MRKTENINLNLYDPSDMFNITGGENSLNKNMEIIDKLINNLQHRVVKKTAADTSVILEENTVLMWTVDNGFVMRLIWHEGCMCRG